MIITRKTQITIVNEGEEKNKAWDILKEYNRITPIACNLVVNHMFFNEIFQDKIILADKLIKEKLDSFEEKLNNKYKSLKTKNKQLKSISDEKEVNNLKKQIDKINKEIEGIKKEKNSVIKEGRNEAKDIVEKVFNTSLNNSIYQLLSDNFPQMPDTIRSPITNSLNFVKKELFGVKQGQTSLRTYKKGMPIPIRGRDLTFIKEEGDVYISWIKGSRKSEEFSTKNPIKFKILFGRDRSDNKSIIDKILKNEYKVSDSSLQLKDNKLFLLLCVDIPEEKYELDEKMVLGVDLGIKVPAYISTNTGHFRMALGSIDDFLKTRLQFQNRRKQVQKSLKYTNGGHGRKAKLKALEHIQNKERNWVSTYNHKISRAIVQNALKQRCATINLELLEGYGNRGKEDFLLRNWSYYELQKFIEYKARQYGITVKYIDPYHTSKTCSSCGHYEEGQRLSQEEFVCKSCEFKENADYNASKNIAKSTKYVTSKSECEFYNK